MHGVPPPMDRLTHHRNREDGFEDANEVEPRDGPDHGHDLQVAYEDLAGGDEATKAVAAKGGRASEEGCFHCLVAVREGR